MNGQIKDGGPAFPCEQHETQDGLWNQTFESGMTLRDYFAAKAMQSLIVTMAHVAMKTGVHPGSGEIGRTAYGYADAMLMAREVQS